MKACVPLSIKVLSFIWEVHVAHVHSSPVKWHLEATAVFVIYLAAWPHPSAKGFGSIRHGFVTVSPSHGGCFLCTWWWCVLVFAPCAWDRLIFVQMRAGPSLLLGNLSWSHQNKTTQMLLRASGRWCATVQRRGEGMDFCVQKIYSCLLLFCPLVWSSIMCYRVGWGLVNNALTGCSAEECCDCVHIVSRCSFHGPELHWDSFLSLVAETLEPSASTFSYWHRWELCGFAL